MRGRKTPLHSWPMSLTAATAKLRLRFARKAPKERRCPGPRYSAGSPSSSRRTVSTPRLSRTIWTMWTPSPSVRPWPSAVSWTAMWWTRKSWTATPLFSRSCGMWRPYPERPPKQTSRNSLPPAIRVFPCQPKNTLRPVARSGSGLPMIQQSLPTMWGILSIWMTSLTKSQSCGMTRCSCCPPA